MTDSTDFTKPRRGRPSVPIAERFWAKVDRRSDDECWEWTASRSSGYGTLRGTKPYPEKAHRIAYELLVGPIPEGLDVDHLCRNRGCVNPRHLEPVTRQENTRRGMAAPSINARKTHCIRGHEFTPENTLRHPMGRNCRECAQLRYRAKRQS